MSQDNTPQNAPDEPSFLNSGSLAFLLLRLWVGLRTMVTGIEKFAGTKVTQEPLLDEFGDPDVSGAMVDIKSKVYGFDYYHGLPGPLQNKFESEPLIPNWALSLYAGSLGYLLIALGALLIVGALPRISLFLTGLLYISLTLGLVLLNESGGVAWLGIHVGLIAFALTQVKHNTLSAYNKY